MAVAHSALAMFIGYVTDPFHDLRIAPNYGIDLMVQSLKGLIFLDYLLTRMSD